MAQLRVVKWHPLNMEYMGKAAVVKNTPAEVWDFDARGNFVLLYKTYTKSALIGMVSGKGVEMSNGVTYYTITLKNQYKEHVFVYVSLQHFRFSAARAEDEKKAKSDAQVLLNNLLANDKAMLVTINRQHELLKQAEAKKVDVTKQRATLMKIADAWVMRQKNIESNTFIQITRKISGNGIGIIPLIVWGLVIGAGAVLVGLTV